MRPDLAALFKNLADDPWSSPKKRLPLLAAAVEAARVATPEEARLAAPTLGFGSDGGASFPLNEIGVALAPMLLSGALWSDPAVGPSLLWRLMWQNPDSLGAELLRSPRYWDMAFPESTAWGQRFESGPVTQLASSPKGSPKASSEPFDLAAWAREAEARSLTRRPLPDSSGEREVALGRALDRGIEAGLLDHLGQSSRLNTWALLCLRCGNSPRMDQAIQAGASFEGVPESAANEAFHHLCAVEIGRWAREPSGGISAKELASRVAEGGEAKRALWARAIEAGMPKIRANPLDEEDAFIQQTPSAAWLLREEARRGGGMEGESLWQWAGAALARRSAMQSKAWGGSTPLAWAFARGMDPKAWTSTMLWRVAAQAREGARVDELLIDLAAAGVKVGAEPKPFTHDYGIPSKSTIQGLLEAGASPAGIAAAQKIGVDMLALSGSGSGALQELLGMSRAGGHGARAEALIQAAEASAPGGAAKLLAMRDKDGAGAMHWAARALCADSVAVFARHGLSPMDRDKAGRTAGHWAAKKYGAKAQKTAGPALAELAKRGQDWAALDDKGASALAALSAKGPIDQIAHIAMSSPAAVDAHGLFSLPASSVLAKRGGGALAVAERAALAGSVGSPDKPKQKPKRRL